MPIEDPSPAVLPPVVLQRRRADPLNDRDVRAKVQADEELTSFEKFLRRMAAQKKPIGGFLIGLGTFLAAAAALYPAKWLSAAGALSGVGGGLLVGGGSNKLKSDDYDEMKNHLLKQRGLM